MALNRDDSRYKLFDTGWQGNDIYLRYRGSMLRQRVGTSAASASTAAGDTQPPAISISSPTNSQTISGSVTISSDATDNVGVAGVQFYLDGQPLGLEISSSPYSINWNTLQASNAPHVLTAVARDAAGNRTTSAAVSVIVSNASPRPYVTNFPLSERTISEGGHWINGKTTAPMGRCSDIGRARMAL
jgi:hypothetical protein